MIAIIDYGMGNLRSVQKAFEKVGAEALFSTAGASVSLFVASSLLLSLLVWQDEAKITNTNR